MKIKMIDTSGGHYAFVLETRKKQDSSILLLEDANADGSCKNTCMTDTQTPPAHIITFYIDKSRN